MEAWGFMLSCRASGGASKQRRDKGEAHCLAGLSEDAPGRQGELVEAFAPVQVLGDLAGEEQGQLTGACVQDAPSHASGAISSATRMAL
jgi:hypothetical protein